MAEVTIEIEAKEILDHRHEIKCRHCKRSTGISCTNDIMYLGNVHFTKQVEMYCNFCSFRIRWRPLSQAKRANAK